MILRFVHAVAPRSARICYRPTYSNLAFRRVLVKFKLLNSLNYFFARVVYCA
jgi:hypothetical protein